MVVVVGEGERGRGSGVVIVSVYILYHCITFIHSFCFLH